MIKFFIDKNFDKQRRKDEKIFDQYFFITFNPKKKNEPTFDQQKLVEQAFSQV